MGLKIELYAPNIFDSLICTDTPFTENQEEILEKTTGTDKNFINWSDFPNGQIVCNFENTINSSFVMPQEGALQGFEILRRENGKNFWVSIYSDTYENFFNSKVGEYFVLTDYNIKNNTTYNYRICSLTDTAVGAFIEDKVTTNWEVFTLTPLVEIPSEKYNTQNVQIQPLIGKDGKAVVWKFYGNCVEQEFTKNQDKTLYDTFTRYPRFSMGESNYFTMSFSGLLGSFDENGQYYEPSTLLEQWNEFIDMGLPCLYKNLKGDKRIVFINNESSLSFNNEYLNRYIDEEDFVTNRPTTININMTEIDDSNKISLCKVGE